MTAIESVMKKNPNLDADTVVVFRCPDEYFTGSAVLCHSSKEVPEDDNRCHRCWQQDVGDREPDNQSPDR